MSLARVNRDYVGKLVEDIRLAINEVLSYSSKPYEELSSAEKYAIRYNIIVLAEALVALAIHLARKAFNKEPETPIHALRILRDEGLLTPSEYDELVRLVRLRNLLVHRYWIIDDKRIYDNVKEYFKPIHNFTERLERLLSNV